MDGSTIEQEQERQFLRDNDSLYTLPLRYVPLETPALRRGRLVKTYPLDTAVEIFKYSDTARGYFLIDDLLSGKANETFGWEDGVEHPDATLLKLLSSLDSYDIYNLRISFRQNNIAYEGYEYLNLSPDLERELGTYMREFTIPLVETIFGDSEHQRDFDGDVIGLLRNPDSEEAMRNLQRLASKLSVQIEDIPRFLEDFSEVYLAISYYKHYTNKICGLNDSVISEFGTVARSLEWKNDPEISLRCAEMQEYLKALQFLVKSALDKFDGETKAFWVDLNEARFRQLQTLVRESQTMVAGILCGIGVKLTRWRDQFPTPEHGAIDRKFDVIRNEIRPGMGRLMAVATGDENFLRV